MSNTHAGLYFDADPGGEPGSGAGAGSNVNTARVSELESQVARLKRELDEQREIQAGLDRTVARKDQQIQELEESVNHYRTISESDGSAMEELRSRNEELSAQVSELSGLQADLERVQRDYGRLQIVMQEHPELSYLAANDALPQAEDDDEFRTKLDNIAAANSSAAEQSAREKLEGSRPPSSPPAGQDGDEDPDALLREATDLIAKGDVEAGTKLMDRYHELKNQ